MTSSYCNDHGRSSKGLLQTCSVNAREQVKVLEAKVRLLANPSIPLDLILRKQRLLANLSMKQANLFPQPVQSGDAFHQVLNGLARKLSHDRSIFLKPGEKVLNWTAGPVGDLKPW
ncbi:hypothetical protein CsatB_014633 [Cannabis sativa]